MCGRASGSSIRTRAPAYQNKTKFKPDRYKALAHVKKILKLPNEGLCDACFKIIEWKKQFNKYKPLAAPRKCAKCSQRTVKYAYHVICQECAESTGECAKCTQKAEIRPFVAAKERREQYEDFSILLRELPERVRRRFIRQYERGEIDSMEETVNEWHKKHGDGLDDWDEDDDDMGDDEDMDEDGDGGSDADDCEDDDEDLDAGDDDDDDDDDGTAAASKKTQPLKKK